MGAISSLVASWQTFTSTAWSASEAWVVFVQSFSLACRSSPGIRSMTRPLVEPWEPSVSTNWLDCDARSVECVRSFAQWLQKRMWEVFSSLGQDLSIWLQHVFFLNHVSVGKEYRQVVRKSSSSEADHEINSPVVATLTSTSTRDIQPRKPPGRCWIFRPPAC